MKTKESQKKKRRGELGEGSHFGIDFYSLSCFNFWSISFHFYCRRLILFLSQSSLSLFWQWFQVGSDLFSKNTLSLEVWQSSSCYVFLSYLYLFPRGKRRGRWNRERERVWNKRWGHMNTKKGERSGLPRRHDNRRRRTWGQKRRPRGR